MAVKVTELKAVDFPAGYLRSWAGEDPAHIAWVRSYSMLVSKRRGGGVVFGDGDVTQNDTSMSDPFVRPALRRCFERALKLAPGEWMLDERTKIHIRRLEKGAVFEINMPCGETACIKESVLRILAEELK